MANWLQIEELNLESISEAVSSLKALCITKDSYNTKVQDLTNEITKLLNEKTTLKSFFSFKSKKENADILEKEKSSLIHEISYINMIINSATYSLYMHITILRQRKLHEYQNAIKYASHIYKGNTLLVNFLII